MNIIFFSNLNGETSLFYFSVAVVYFQISLIMFTPLLKVPIIKSNNVFVYFSIASHSFITISRFLSLENIDKFVKKINLFLFLISF